MSPWMAASAVLALSLLPCALVVFRGGAFDRLVALEMSSVVLTLLLATLAEGMGRGPFIDLAVALSVLALGGALVFVRTMERWL